MEKLICLLFIFLLPSVVFAGEVTRKSFLDCEATEHIYYIGDEEVGRRSYSANGNMIEEIGEVPDGIVEEYEEKRFFVFGGKCEDTGKKLIKVVNFKDGKKEGIEINYASDGNLISEENYKNGIKDGIQKWYYPNGKLNSESNYKDGKKNGITRVYQTNGQLAREELYKDGELISK